MANKKDAKHRMRLLPSWELKGDTIAKEFVFKDFNQAFDFMTRCAVVAEKLKHHPDWTNSYNKVDVRLTTHNTNGLTELDFKLAQRMNEAEKSILG